MENVESTTKSSPMNLSARSNERNVLKELNNIDSATKSPKEIVTTDTPGNVAKVSTPVIGTDVDLNGGSIVVNTNLLNVTTTYVQSPDDGLIRSPLVASSPAVRTNSSVESMLQSQTHLHSGSIETEFDEKLNATHTLATDGFPSCPQDTTFISTNNQTVLIESGSPNLENKAEVIESTTVTENLVDGAQLNQTQKIDNFKSNQGLSADSLELDASPKLEEYDPSTPPDQRMSVVTAEQIFSSRKAPTFSEMFPNSTHSSNDEFNKATTNKQWDASFVIGKADLADEISPYKNAINETIVLDAKDKTMLMANVESDVPAFEFKPPSVPFSAVEKSNKQKEDTNNFMVLNPNDFEFLQSRGTNSPNPDDDPRSSLLLRFDPLVRRSLHPTQQKPSVPDRSELDKTLTSSNQTISIDDRSTGELPSNGHLVEVANDMDDDTNSYMNNVRIEKNGDKVISVDGVLLTNKKIDITSVDESIRKKMEEYEATQEILLKRITEKDKAITKTSNVLELYEKAIADFEFLQSRGTNSPNPDDDPRSSLLLRFDPLVRRSLHPTQQKPSVPDRSELDKTLTSSNQTISIDDRSTGELPSNGHLVEVANDMDDDTNSYMNNVRIEKNGDKVISVDGVLLTNKKIDITSVDESIRKKMKEYEATQEILLKRITEKDKAITKTSNVLELYEKAIAEALAAKEKLSQNYEKEHEELKTDRDVTFQHLLSLESTFADLHMKFERNVQYTSQLQEKLNAVSEDKSKAEDLLRQQELRYDKMKSHTMQQFDIANAKLEQQTRTISLDNTKLKAQIKREEIHKNAVAEELSQKKKENEELAKICDELISDQRN